MRRVRRASSMRKLTHGGDFGRKKNDIRRGYPESATAARDECPWHTVCTFGPVEWRRTHVREIHLTLQLEELRAIETALFTRGDEVLDHAKEVAKTIRERVHIATIRSATTESNEESSAAQAEEPR